jgi:hypothetical protein
MEYKNILGNNSTLSFSDFLQTSLSGILAGILPTPRNINWATIFMAIRGAIF